MVDKVILGLLSKKDLTVYDIKVAMDKSISQFYSSSFGSINPTVKKMEQKNLIQCSEHIVGSRLKKVYNITNKGKSEYEAWLASPIQQGRIKDEFLVRVFFLGDTDTTERKRLLSEYMNELESSKQQLERMTEEIHNRDLSSFDEEVLKYQLATLRFGKDYFDFKQEWINRLIDEA